MEKNLNIFHKKATSKEIMPMAEEKIDVIPDFARDAHFGLMSKCSIAWESVCQSILEESAFFSLSHTLETEVDLEASILLASDCFYKHALETLRNYLESVVLQLYFCNNSGDFAKWREGTFKVPSFRHKKDGLLVKIQNQGIFHSGLSKLASELYSDLNESIHGAEHRLINTGLLTGDWKGLTFKYDYFVTWCDYFARCINIGIPTLRLTTNLWLKNRPQDSVVCDVCHNEDINQFEILKTSTGISFKCKKCGHEMNFNSKWAIKHGFMQ